MHLNYTLHTCTVSSLSVCLSVCSVCSYSMSETVSIMSKRCVQKGNQELLKDYVPRSVRKTLNGEKYHISIIIVYVMDWVPYI